MDKKSEVKKIFAAIFASQDRLRSIAPQFNWKGMGNLLGDFGEFLAIEEYQLEKAPPGSGNFDALTKDGKTVQIKANFSASHVGIRGEADLLLVVGIDSTGDHEEIYFGDFEAAKRFANFSGRDNKWMISIKKLRQLNK